MDSDEFANLWREIKVINIKLRIYDHLYHKMNLAYAKIELAHAKMN